MKPQAGLPEWPKGAGSRPAGADLPGFESLTPHLKSFHKKTNFINHFLKELF